MLSANGTERVNFITTFWVHQKISLDYSAMNTDLLL